jgi:hypothetical protein
MSQDGRNKNLHFSELADERNNVEVALDTLFAWIVDVRIRFDVEKRTLLLTAPSARTEEFLEHVQGVILMSKLEFFVLLRLVNDVFDVWIF